MFDSDQLDAALDTAVDFIVGAAEVVWDAVLIFASPLLVLGAMCVAVAQQRRNKMHRR